MNDVAAAHALSLMEAGLDVSGDFQRTLDDKGRLVFPAQFRETFADGLFLLPGLDGCVEVMTAEGIRLEKMEILKQSRWSREVREERAALTSAIEASLDAQHRLTLPSEMRATFSLERDLMVRGDIDRVQIWDLGTYRTWIRKAQAARANRDVG